MLVLQCFGNEINIIKEYLFNQFVPCGVCASDLKNWLRTPATKQFTSEISCFHQSRNVSEAETKFHPNPISRNLASAFAWKLISVSFLTTSFPGRDEQKKCARGEKGKRAITLHNKTHVRCHYWFLEIFFFPGCLAMRCFRMMNIQLCQYIVSEKRKRNEFLWWLPRGYL